MLKKNILYGTIILMERYNMKKLLLILFITVIELFAQHQGGLMVMPRNIHFMDNFNRSKHIFVENNSSGTITIDSIIYNPNIYFIRLNNASDFPIVMPPFFEFEFEIIQYNYFNLTPGDSASTITIYNSSSDSAITLEIHHNQNMNCSKKSIVNGSVEDSINVLADAKIYFFYNRIVLVDSATTDANGNFTKELPVGDYFIAAVKEGYYVEYAFDKDSPLGADVIFVREDSTVTLDFFLENESATNLNLSGVINDVSGGTLPKAVVVVRKGKHNPTKISAVADDDINRIYTTFTDVNGLYNLKNIKYEGDYFIQVFAPFNIPGYYNENGEPSVYWQDADSVALINSMANIDLTLERDSSYGAGFVNGSVLSNNQNTPVTDAIVYVRSINNNKIYTYNFVSSDGNYTIPVLPYGDYKLIAQKIGVPDAESNSFSITTSQDTLNGINISMILTSVKNIDTRLSFEILQNYPNPFNPSTTISFSLSKSSNIKLNIYDALGKIINTLIDNVSYASGFYKVIFDAQGLTSGVYFCELRAGDYSLVMKMNLLK